MVNNDKNTKDVGFPTEQVSIEELKPHPKNYRSHPIDQIEHLMNSIESHGFYRNIVVSRDGYILAGHGVVEAAKALGYDTVPVIRINVDSDDTRALKIMAGDNEIAHLGEIDDRALTELLKEIRDMDVDGLLGTGFDDMMLANLVYITRPEHEIQDHNEAAHWVGMPEYEPITQPIKMQVNFETYDDREEFARLLNLRITDKTRSVWWPQKDKDDMSSIRFENVEEE